MSRKCANIINLLNLIASPSDHLEYQKLAPVNVSTELVNQWFEDFYHPTDERFMSEFSSAELASLDKFHTYYETRDAMLPATLDEMLKTAVWRGIMDVAGEVLDEHGWRGIEAHYDMS